jgi:hypothetical protein
MSVPPHPQQTALEGMPSHASAAVVGRHLMAARALFQERVGRFNPRQP